MDLIEPLDDIPNSSTSKGRVICNTCDRPVRVCLCHVFPPSRISTQTRILIVQHPLESKHKLNTASVITKSISNAALVKARRLPPDFQHPAFHPNLPTFYLFTPTASAPAVTLSKVMENYKPSEKGPEAFPAANLIVFDATWHHAKEMVSASEDFLKRSATRVCLDGFDADVEGGSIFDSELILRKEPSGGCVSTAEAVARWLAVMEANGPEISEQIISILREMVKLQAQFVKPMDPRPKMLKKNKRRKEPLEMPSNDV